MHAHVSNSSKNMHGQLIVAFRLISGVTWRDYFDIMLLNHKERNVYNHLHIEADAIETNASTILKEIWWKWVE